MIMATYDSLPNGVVKDGLFGEQVATGEWSNLAHPWPLCQVMEALAWLPREFGRIEKTISCAQRPSSRKSATKKAKSSTAALTRRQERKMSCDFRFAQPLSTPIATVWMKGAILEKMDIPIDPLPNGDCIVTLRTRWI